ncbi:hypothetical protein ACFL5G_05170 [Candidatus Margulisiibacteriota bacterium]
MYSKLISMNESTTATRGRLVRTLLVIFFSLFFVASCMDRKIINPFFSLDPELEDPGDPAPITKTWEVMDTAGFSEGAVSDIAIHRDESDGTVYVAYQNSSDGGVTIKKFSAGSWVTVGPLGLDTGILGADVSIYSRNGTPYVVYKDNSQSGKLTVRSFDGANWNVVDSPGMSVHNGNCREVQLYVEPSGHIHPYYTDTETVPNTVTLMNYEGGSWYSPGGANLHGGTPDLTALGSKEMGISALPCGAYRSGSSVVIEEFNYLFSVFQSIGSTSCPSDDFDLAYNNEYPYLAYIDGTMLKVKKLAKQNANQTLEVYETTVAAGSSNVSLYIQADGTVYVTYADGAQGGKVTAMKVY